MFEVKNIFDILREADDDDTGGAEISPNGDGAAESSGGDDSGGGDNNSDDGGDSEEGDFDVDTDLSSADGGDSGGDDGGGGDDFGSSDDSSSSSDDEGEANQANTDIFSSLTKEEQQLKIGELKNLFGEIYSRSDDVLERISDLDQDEIGIQVISRLSSSVYRLRNYLSDYIVKVFPNKSYIENKTIYFEFLTSINTITQVIENIIKEKQKEEKNE